MRHEPINWLSSRAEVIATLMRYGLEREEATRRVDNPRFIKAVAWRNGIAYYNEDDLYQEKQSATNPSFTRYFLLQSEN